MAAELDAIVVGGGLAGVTAARDLEQAGLRTLLVEARDSLGGRTPSRTLAGHEIDTGGAYFHWFQSAIWREVMRYELPIVESALVTAERYLLGDRDGITPFSAEEFDERQRRALAAFWDDPRFAAALARPFAIQTNATEIAELDAVSVEQRLQELDLDPTDEYVLRAILGDFGSTDETSLAWLLQRMANGVWSNEAYNALFAIYRLADGMVALIDAIVRDGGFAVKLSSPVTAITYGHDGGTVTLADGTELSAKVVVVATPVSIWKTIDFTPPLDPVRHSATIEGVVIPRVSNMMMHVRGLPAEPVAALSTDDQPFEILGTHQMLDDGQILHGISISGATKCADGHEQIEKALRKILPDAVLVDFVGQDWDDEPYSLGSWAALRRGQLTRFIDVLDQPTAGRLFFAGADIAPQFSGMLTGAIESGARAAQRIKQTLRIDSTPR